MTWMCYLKTKEGFVKKILIEKKYPDLVIYIPKVNDLFAENIKENETPKLENDTMKFILINAYESTMVAEYKEVREPKE